MLSPYRRNSALGDVLYALSMSAEERTGPVIAGEIGRSPACVYPILARLESAGWVDSRWSPHEARAGARQRLYQLSAHGVVAARRHRTRGRSVARTRRAALSVLSPLPHARSEPL